MGNENKIKRIQSYSIKYTTYENGTSLLETTNDGFNGLELLGVFEFKQTDVIKKMEGDMGPNKIERKIVVDDSFKD